MSGRPISEMGFNELKHLAMSKNLKYTFKTKTELIQYLKKNNIHTDDRKTLKKKAKLKHTETETETDHEEMDYSSSTEKVKIHTEQLSKNEVERLKTILKKLYSTNKLTELEKVQKYVFTQLGIL